MENKQTAVEWLVNELENHHVFHDIKNTVAFQQAKAMEKEQIMKAFLFQSPIGDGVITAVQKAEQYYKENYDKKSN
jgi:hypothetical protein